MRKKILGGLIIIFVVGIFISASVKIHVNNEKYKKERLNFYKSLGKESHEFDHLVAKIKKDFSIEEGVIVVITRGPPPENIAIDLRYKPYIILFRSYYYDIFSPSERSAMIGHEMGHILFPLEDLRSQVLCDTIAANYTDTGAILSALDKIYGPSRKSNRDYIYRMLSLEKVDGYKKLISRQ